MALWYEVNEPKVPLVKVYCPVCKKDGLLGRREKNCLFMEHCDDCKAIYTWQPHEDIPTVILDSTLRHKHCGCGGCRK